MGLLGRLAFALLCWGLISCEGKYRKFGPATGELNPGPGGNGAEAGASTSTVSVVPDAAVEGPTLGGVGGGRDCSDDDCLASAADAGGRATCVGGAEDCPVPCPGCLIAGECVGAGISNPENVCEICDPARDAQRWSADDERACDDGGFCTVEDRCSAGLCVGVARACDDGVDCNGVSECDEDGDRCTPDENQCTGGQVCDLGSRSCQSTCTGCLVDGVCVSEGGELAGNPCMVCDTSRSTTAYSPAVGRNCGAAATTCSAQDTCDQTGVCRPNHLALGSACGSASVTACDSADTCDGSGSCRPNLVSNGTSCNDGRFCSVGDECQGGACISDAELDCGALSTCNEAADQCVCTGCGISGTCVASGTVNPDNPCQLCDRGRSATAFSSKVEGSFCGSGQQCSATSLCRFTGTGLLSAGFWDTCQIEDGQVLCVNAGRPIALGTNRSALQISSGQHHTCALLDNGNVRCWGDSLGSDRGQLGTTTLSSEDGVIFFGNVQLGGRAVSISAGTESSCAVMETGSVRCWGVNLAGQLGYGHTNNIGDEASDFPLVDVNLGGLRAIQVDTGNDHTCAVLEGGALRCWGSGFAGALGYGNELDQLSPPSTNISVGVNVVQVATGSAHTCALTTAGLRCWGLNLSGQLGYGHTQNIGDDETPAQAVTRTVTLATGAVRPLGGNVAVGGVVAQVQIRQGSRDGNKTCARLMGGAVRCWGSTSNQGGIGYPHRSSIGANETPAEASETLTSRLDAQGNPIRLGGDLALGGSATTLADGGDQCALRTDGQVVCWRGPEQLPTIEAF